MTAEDVQTLLRIAEEAAALAGPYAAAAVTLTDTAVHLAAVLLHKGDMTPEQVADVKARAQVADDAWDAAVAKARQAAADKDAQAGA